MHSTNLTQINFNKFILKEMRQCKVIRPMNDEQFDDIVRASKALELPANSMLFEQGSNLSYIYLLISGGIKLQRLAPNGDEKVLDIIQPGKTFAEAALFVGNSEYPVSAVAISPCTLVGIHADTYLRLLQGSTELCINLLGDFSKRLRWMVNEVERLTLHNATFRLVDYLLSQVKDDQEANTAFSLAVPKRVIASRLSVKPETLSRTLKELSRLGLINLKGSRIELNDINELRKFISLDS